MGRSGKWGRNRRRWKSRANMLPCLGPFLHCAAPCKCLQGLRFHRANSHDDVPLSRRPRRLPDDALPDWPCPRQRLIGGIMCVGERPRQDSTTTHDFSRVVPNRQPYFRFHMEEAFQACSPQAPPSGPLRRRLRDRAQSSETLRFAAVPTRERRDGARGAADQSPAAVGEAVLSATVVVQCGSGWWLVQDPENRVPAAIGRQLFQSWQPKRLAGSRDIAAGCVCPPHQTGEAVETGWTRRRQHELGDLSKLTIPSSI